jgi:hypothetical protein
MTKRSRHLNQDVPLYDRAFEAVLSAIHEGIPFLEIYFHNRPWFLWPLAFPAVAATFLTLFVVGWISVQTATQIEAQLNRHLAEAVQQQDWPRRNFCVQALLWRYPDNRDYQLAYQQWLFADGSDPVGQDSLEQWASEKRNE